VITLAFGFEDDKPLPVPAAVYEEPEYTDWNLVWWRLFPTIGNDFVFVDNHGNVTLNDTIAFDNYIWTYAGVQTVVNGRWLLTQGKCASIYNKYIVYTEDFVSPADIFWVYRYGVLHVAHNVTLDRAGQLGIFDAIMSPNGRFIFLSGFGTGFGREVYLYEGTP